MTSGLPGCWGVCWHSCGSVGIPTRSAWLPLPCQPKSPAFPFFFMLKFNRWAWHSPWRSGYMPWCRFLRWLFSTLERSLTLEHHLELGWWISRVRWCFFLEKHYISTFFFQHVSMFQQMFQHFFQQISDRGSKRHHPVDRLCDVHAVHQGALGSVALLWRWRWCMVHGHGDMGPKAWFQQHIN